MTWIKPSFLWLMHRGNWAPGNGVTGLTDITSQARTIAELVRNGQAARARRLLPPERPYPVPGTTARRLLIDT